MDSEDRDLAVRKLETDSEAKVMVSILKCGSLGLNLAFASRVISVYCSPYPRLFLLLTFYRDLWWNTCMYVVFLFCLKTELNRNYLSEAQAFGRVYRIPQHRTTYFTRLIVANSVDDRLEKCRFGAKTSITSILLTFLAQCRNRRVR